MTHYLDISLLPDSEFPTTILMNALFSKLHKALCDLQSNDIGVSFPQKASTLGCLIRLHGSAEVIRKLQKLNWVGAMSGYCRINDITPVPPGVKYRTVSRKRSTMSQSKLNRLLKRGSINEADVSNYQGKMYAKFLDDPFIQLVSGSNGHKHRRYIEFGQLLDEPVIGQFDQFGLSKTATVPWF